MTRRMYWSSQLNQEIVHDMPTVYEQEHAPVDTGLIDEMGRHIMRSDDPEPLGYIDFHRPVVRRKAISRKMS